MKTMKNAIPAATKNPAAMNRLPAGLLLLALAACSSHAPPASTGAPVARSIVLRLANTAIVLVLRSSR